MKTILLVEDNESIAALIYDILLDEGYAPVLALTCHEALMCLQTMQPDLIICDLMLPDGTSESLGYFVRAQEALCNVPIVLMSAGERPVCSQQHWYTTYVSKPFTIEFLSQTVKRLVERA